MSGVKRFPAREDGRVTSFVGIEVGDKFLRRDGHYDTTVKLVECSRVTAKQCVIDGITYRIADALELGRYHRSSRGHPANYSVEAHEAGEREMRIRRFRQILSDLRWEKVPADKIEAVWAVVGDLVDPAKETV